MNKIEINVVTGQSIVVPLSVAEVEALQSAASDVGRIVSEKTALIDAHILAVLNGKGYDGQHSIAKYQNLTDAQIAGLPVDERPFATQWRSECQAAALWIVRAYTAGLKVLADVQAGTRQAPSDAELIAELPAMVWPEG